MTARPARITGAETAVAEEFASVLDMASRVDQGLSTAQWHYLWQTSAQLAQAAAALHDRLSAQDGRFDSNLTLRPSVVRPAAIREAQLYRAGRALHPDGADGA